MKRKGFKHAEEDMGDDHDPETCPVGKVINADSFQGLINDVEAVTLGYFMACEKEDQKIGRIHFFIMIKVFLDFYQEELEVPKDKILEMCLEAMGFESESIEMDRDQLTEILTEGGTVH
jgi:hypothetical protein